MFAQAVHRFYAKHAGERGVGAKSRAVTVVQRTSSDLRLNPHLRVVFLDGASHIERKASSWCMGTAPASANTRIGEVLETTHQPIAKRQFLAKGRPPRTVTRTSASAKTFSRNMP